ncbi:hypothetical protein [Caulobacter sp. CCH9-E1]|jgi:hypothetical protein|uniref:hypothetical protein n=1 Tax=Caulobacter sp. CCH9-E1 TaxID=1768768 RepID=UPI000A5E4E3E|nr:hypothetical protein [Caulobacter sp. CCH9-E1]
MSTTVTPEVAALEQFLTQLTGIPSSTPMLTAIENYWPTSAPNKLMDVMRSLHALEQITSELPTAGMRRIAEKTIAGLVVAFSTQNLLRDISGFRAAMSNEIHLATSNLELFHDLKIDRDNLINSAEEIDRSIDDLMELFAKSEMSDSSKSVISAQMELLKKSIDRFNKGTVGPFRDSAFSVIGRVVIQIHGDTKLKSEDARKLVDDVLRLAGLIDAGSKILTLAAPHIAGLLPPPSH